MAPIVILIPIGQVDSAARLLQSAMRSFVFRRQTLSKRPPLPPRGDTSSATPDTAQAVFDTVDAAGGGRDRRDTAGAGGSRRGVGLARQSTSRKSVAGAVGGGWEASGAHAASTLADVFPPEAGEEDKDEFEDGFQFGGRRLGGAGGRGEGLQLAEKRTAHMMRRMRRVSKPPLALRPHAWFDSYLKAYQKT